jgi:hypothetical protein
VEHVEWMRLVREQLSARDATRGGGGDRVVLARQSSGGERHMARLSEEWRHVAELKQEEGNG